MEHRCKISQTCRGPYICLQCPKMVRLVTTSRFRAASDLYNVEFQVLSSTGPGYTTTISPTVANPLCTFTLGHFAENDGEHWFCLADEYNSSEINIEAEYFANLQSDPSQDLDGTQGKKLIKVARKNETRRTMNIRVTKDQTLEKMIMRVGTG